MKQEEGHGGNIWQAEKETGISMAELTDFSANLNPLGPPNRVLELIREKAEVVRYYPEPRANSLRKKFAAAEQLPEKRLLFGNGAAELIYLFCRVLQPKNVLLPAPTFSQYKSAVQAAGGKIEYVLMSPADNFSLPLAKMKKAISSRKHDFAVICNPNNPTGTMTGRDELMTLVSAARQAGTMLLVDESFMGFLPKPFSDGLLDEVRNGASDIFIIRSMTKLYSLPGLRLGYGTGPEAIVSRMEECRDPWSVNALAQLAGLACFEQDAYVEESVKLIDRERMVLSQRLREMDFVVYPSSANFLLCSTNRHGICASKLREKLYRQGIIIRDCTNFYGLDPSYFRLSINLPQTNEKLLRELRLVLGCK